MLISVEDVYSSVLHIKSSDGSRFISEAEYDNIKRELDANRTQEDLKKHEDEANTYHNFVLNTRTPEQIIRNKLESYNERLRMVFSGTETKAYEGPENSTEEEIARMCIDMTELNHEMSYVPFTTENDKHYIVEHMRGQPANAESLMNFIMNECQSVQLDVS